MGVIFYLKDLNCNLPGHIAAIGSKNGGYIKSTHPCGWVLFNIGRMGFLSVVGNTAVVLYACKYGFIAVLARSSSSISSRADIRSTPERRELICTRASEVATRTW